MNLAIAKIELSVAVVAVVGVLIGEHGDVLANGIVTLVLQADGASGIFCGFASLGVIIWIVVLQRQVLQHQILAGVQQRGGHANTLGGRSVLDHYAVLALTLDGDVVASDGGECLLSQVVGAVRQIDGHHVRAARAVGSIECIEEAAGITGKYGKRVAFLRVVCSCCVQHGDVVYVCYGVER